MSNKRRFFALLAGFALFVPLVPARADDPAIRPEEGLPLIDWKDAGKFVGREVIVQGRIEAAGQSRSIIFLNFDRARSFTAIVRKKNEGNFPKPPAEMYAGKLVQIRGTITTFKNKPQIEVTRAEQVTIVDKPGDTTSAKPTQRAHEFKGTVTIATYNVLNLFDAHDDPYHQDEGTPEKPRSELERLAATIHKVDADVIALEEVENRGILENFNRALLSDMGYHEVVCIDSNDGRGIDCAVLSRFPVGPVTSYRHVQFDDTNGGKTRFRRDLLRVRIEPPRVAPFDVFAVHLKSKHGGNDSEHVRMSETMAIRNILEDELHRDPKALFVLCGDFNDTWDSKPIRQLRDTAGGRLKAFVSEIPEGTVTYNREPYRNMIDYIFCSPAMAAHYVGKSIHVVSGTVESSGSDHNPVVMKFDLRGSGAAKTADVGSASTVAGN